MAWWPCCGGRTTPRRMRSRSRPLRAPEACGLSLPITLQALRPFRPRPPRGHDQPGPLTSDEETTPRAVFGAGVRSPQGEYAASAQNAGRNRPDRTRRSLSALCAVIGSVPLRGKWRPSIPDRPRRSRSVGCIGWLLSMVASRTMSTVIAPSASCAVSHRASGLPLSGPSSAVPPSSRSTRARPQAEA